MNQDRQTFGIRLKEKREAKDLSVADVARITKIPRRSLELLEAGSFDRLPAEVFVRGFLKSYCRCVGLDTDETLRRYGEILYDGRAPKPASLAVPAAVAMDEDVQGDRTQAPAPPPAPPEEPTVFTQAMTDANRSTRRIGLTLAVIILVIVATLTLSLLLRRPSHVGDGLSLGSVSSETVS